MPPGDEVFAPPLPPGAPPPNKEEFPLPPADPKPPNAGGDAVVDPKVGTFDDITLPNVFVLPEG